MGDWLDTEEAPDDWLGPAETETDPLPVIFGQVAPVDGDPAARNVAVRAAWDKLTPRQKVFLQMWPSCRYNTSEVCRRLEGTADAVSRDTASHWDSQSEAFRFVKRVMRNVARESVVDPDKLLLRADEIAEKALEPTPILYQGQPTGFYEHDLKTALSANEQLMKTQKMLGGAEDEAKVFGGRSIVFQVQVVQSDGTLRDAKPTGVVIDMPVPDGNG